jgi:hypothetical protein
MSITRTLSILTLCCSSALLAQRGVEWAATGKVTQTIPPEMAAK